MHQVYTQLEISTAEWARTPHTTQKCIKLRAECITKGRNGNLTVYDLFPIKKLLRNFETENRKK